MVLGLYIVKGRMAEGVISVCHIVGMAEGNRSDEYFQNEYSVYLFKGKSVLYCWCEHVRRFICSHQI